MSLKWMPSVLPVGEVRCTIHDVCCVESQLSEHHGHTAEASAADPVELPVEKQLEEVGQFGGAARSPPGFQLWFVDSIDGHPLAHCPASPVGSCWNPSKDPKRRGHAYGLARLDVILRQKFEGHIQVG